MARYEVIERKYWQHDSGATASIYGAAPYGQGWRVVTSGYTLRDTRNGTVGHGPRPPLKTREEAETLVTRLES